MASLTFTLGRLQERVPHLRRVEPGGASLEVTLARSEPPNTASARLLEEPRLTSHAIPVDRAPVCTAFLDGIQESREVGWLGTLPLVYGVVAAVVRERRDRRLSTWGEGCDLQRAVYAPWSMIAQRDRALFQEYGLSTRDVTVRDDLDRHPLRVVQELINAVKQDREVLERELATRFCQASAGTLYVDGPYPASELVHEWPNVIGVVKSHQTIYASDDLAVVFGLQEGERSSVFAVESRHRQTVASWYLRLRSTEGRGPFWGLVRVEVPLWLVEQHGVSEVADERSAWVFAERAPAALPDGRWDTMAYGIRSCEEYLRGATG